jgi:CRP-like cAMP-binding protein
LLRSRPEAAVAVLKVVARRLRQTDQRASDLAFPQVSGRLARKLLELASRHGVLIDSPQSPRKTSPA